MREQPGLRYIAYVRKSEEREERQELSHAAQVRTIKQQFAHLNVVKWMEPESKSAFKPGRKLFNEMIKLIQDNKADAIVAYHPNRISRNEIDAATITYFVRTGIVKDIKFCAYSFENSPEGIMMLQMVMSQSQYESSKQGREVKRGMEQKAISGERPGVVPLGYIKSPILDSRGEIVLSSKHNTVITKTERDPARYFQVEQMWKMLLSGQYNAAQIRKIANEKFGLTSKTTRRVIGKPIGYSTIYRMFTNPFYAGMIPHNGELHKGNHDAMISLEQFDLAQKLLGQKGKPRSGINPYAYAGLIKCGECGCQIVGKTNQKYNKTEGRVKTYVHYYCTRKSLLRPCTQSKYTSLEALELEIDHVLDKVTILPEFKELALDILRRKHATETKERTSTYNSQFVDRKRIQDQLDKLVDMRTNDLLTDEEYSSQKKRYNQELNELDGDLRQTEVRANNWIQAAEQAFEFITNAKETFKNGSPEDRRRVFMGLGQNFTLKDQKLDVELREWLVPIANNYQDLEQTYLDRVRTKQKTSSTTVSEEAFTYVSENWRARRDSNPRHSA